MIRCFAHADLQKSKVRLKSEISTRASLSFSGRHEVESLAPAKSLSDVAFRPAALFSYVDARLFKAGCARAFVKMT